MQRISFNNCKTLIKQSNGKAKVNIEVSSWSVLQNSLILFHHFKTIGSRDKFVIPST